MRVASLPKYLMKIDTISQKTRVASSHLVCRLRSQDGRTSFFEELSRRTISNRPSKDSKTRQDDIEKSRPSVRPMSSYRRTIANPAENCGFIDMLPTWIKGVKWKMLSDIVAVFFA